MHTERIQEQDDWGTLRSSATPRDQTIVNPPLHIDVILPGILLARQDNASAHIERRQLPCSDAAGWSALKNEHGLQLVSVGTDAQ